MIGGPSHITASSTSWAVTGMGVVYKALDGRLGRSVALKFHAGRPCPGRPCPGAKAASALKRPNICNIHDIGNENGQPFIVMEFLEGATLRIAFGFQQVHPECGWLSRALACAIGNG